MLAARHRRRRRPQPARPTRLTDTGTLHGPRTHRRRPTRSKRGDRVVTLRNDYDLDVRNGTLATVTKVHPRRGELTIRTDAGATQRLPAAYLDAGHVDHGYAITIHKAQGLTVDRAFVLGSDDLYRELGYVALSRGRLSNDLYLAEPAPREHAHRLEQGPEQRIAHTLATDHQQTLGIDR